jgi:hypothetical protein
MIALPVCESRLPVGSPASTIDRLLISARTTATPLLLATGQPCGKLFFAAGEYAETHRSYHGKLCGPRSVEPRHDGT